MLRLEALPKPTVRRRRVLRAISGIESRGAQEPPPGGAREGARPGPHSLPTELIGLLVVIVDDDPDALDLFAAMLRACGAAVATAGNAADALALIAGHRPHVVVSDIAMAGGDGYWLVSEVRRLDKAVSGVPVIACTAFGREHSRARVLAGGFTDHLQKPVDPEVLCRAVARAAGR
jgi:CheY-like chemotaxis protein